MLSRVSQFTQHFNSSVRSHTGNTEENVSQVYLVLFVLLESDW